MEYRILEMEKEGLSEGNLERSEVRWVNIK